MKGKDHSRVRSHFRDTKLKLGYIYRSDSDKAQMIRSIWSNNEPIIVVKVGDFIDHYEASSKEYALILSLASWVWKTSEEEEKVDQYSAEETSKTLIAGNLKATLDISGDIAEAEIKETFDNQAGDKF